MFGCCCVRDAGANTDYVQTSNATPGQPDGEDYEPGCYNGDEEWGEGWDEGWEHWEENWEDWQGEEYYEQGYEEGEAGAQEQEIKEEKPPPSQEAPAPGTPGTQPTSPAKSLPTLPETSPVDAPATTPVSPEATPEPAKAVPVDDDEPEQGTGFFSIMLEKKRFPNGSLGRCGMGLAHRPLDTELMVEAIYEGAVTDWNSSNPKKAVKPNDRILEINGFRGPARELLRLIQTEAKMNIEMERPAPGEARRGLAPRQQLPNGPPK